MFISFLSPDDCFESSPLCKRYYYELVANEGPSKTQAKAAAEEVRKDVLAHLSNQCHMQSYKKVKAMLMADTLTTTSLDMTG
jgi:hypothetical protein